MGVNLLPVLDFLRSVKMGDYYSAANSYSDGNRFLTSPVDGGRRRNYKFLLTLRCKKKEREMKRQKKRKLPRTCASPINFERPKYEPGGEGRKEKTMSERDPLTRSFIRKTRVSAKK